METEDNLTITQKNLKYLKVKHFAVHLYQPVALTGNAIVRVRVKSHSERAQASKVVRGGDADMRTAAQFARIRR